MTPADPRRRLPSVESVVHAGLAALDGNLARDSARRWLTQLARGALSRSRVEGGTVDAGDLGRSLAAELAALARGGGRIVNATGVALQTNLGRSPLSQAALDRVSEVAAGYSDLEYSLAAGVRGERGTRVSRAFEALVGTPAVVVNNNAAALLLALTTLARGREVLVSRGELIEIGGSFRLPDVMRMSGAKLVEVGTTNRTRLADYEAAITPRTALILKVHTSNYQVVGFTETVAVAELAGVARKAGIPLVDDLGSGTLLPTHSVGLRHEPEVGEALAAGADLLTFSGDKLLGGPQAGILVGRADLLARLRRHPLYRPLRPDKLTLAALEATLGAYLRGTARTELPLWRSLSMSEAATRRRATAWAAALDPGAAVAVVRLETAVGGGSCPARR